MTRQTSPEVNVTASARPPALLAKSIKWIIQILPVMALAVIPLCVLSLSTAVSDLRTYPGFDLRPKVVGARAVAASLDPYDLDAVGRQNDYFKSTTTPLYTPALLMMYVPLSDMPFETQRAVYFWLDWAFAAAAFYLLFRYLSLDRRRRYLCWIVYATFILCSYAFRIHVERGQYYMLLLLLMCYTAASLKNNWTGWLNCLPTALLMVLRPTYGLILIFVLVCMDARTWVLRVLALTAGFFLLTLPLVGLHAWMEFIHVAGLRQADHLAQLMMTCKVSLTAIATSGSGNDPYVIEHNDFSKLLPHPAINGTFIGLISWVADTVSKAHRLPAVVCSLLRSTSMVNSTLVLAVLAGGVCIGWVARKRQVSRNVAIACALLWPMLFEIFGPERFLYTAVLEVLPFLLLAMDGRVFHGVAADASGAYRLVAFLLLGLVPTVLFQIGNLGFLKQTLDSALILLALPLTMAVMCLHSILRSPERI